MRFTNSRGVDKSKDQSHIENSHTQFNTNEVSQNNHAYNGEQECSRIPCRDDCTENQCSTYSVDSNHLNVDVSETEESRILTPDSESVVANNQSDLNNSMHTNLSVNSNQASEDPLIVDANIPSDQNETMENYPDFRCIEKCGFFLSELHRKFDKHSSFGCSLKDIKLLDVKRKAMKVQYFLKCDYCGYRDSIWSEPEDDQTFDINMSAVIGTITSGVGYNTYQEFCATLNVGYMCPESYRNYREQVLDIFIETAADCMSKAAEEEKRAAIERGDVINGIPFITVVADGQWSKRSYGHSYDALSGVGVILGHLTGKVLYVGIRNKYCSYCAYYERKGVDCPDHRCFKNFDRNASSTSMESDAIAEGFKRSIEMHGLIYKVLIADNDSNVYNAIMNSRPYDNHNIVVEKIQCSNHLYRNLCKHLTKLAETPQPRGQREPGYVQTRNFINKNILNIRNEIHDAAVFRNNSDIQQSEKAKELLQDILLIPQHVFGDHTLCATRGLICPSVRASTDNHLPAIIQHGFDSKIHAIMRTFSSHAASLLLNVTNNAAELFNSVLCKLIGGKRIFFSARCSNDMRVLGTVVQNNTHQLLTELHRNQGKKTPLIIENLEKQRQQALVRTQMYRTERGRTKAVRSNNQSGEFYGPNSQQPDMNLAAFEALKEDLLEKLRNNAENWENIEQLTREQSNNDRWKSLRQSMLTSSHFGEVCRKQPWTSCETLVKKVLYPSRIQTESMRYGIENEETARLALTAKIDKEVSKCGLFIDVEHPFLGTSPDGLVGSDGLVEIKCPFSAKALTVAEAFNTVKTIKSIFKNDLNKMNPNHHYYYQVQGQLNITKKQYCLFTIWTPKDLHVVKVNKDEVFWREKMMPHLCKFYMDCLLPEIVDSRQNRHMPIRNPEYISKAIEVHRAQKERGEKRKRPANEPIEGLTPNSSTIDNTETDSREEITVIEDVSVHPFIPQMNEEQALAYNNEVLVTSGTADERRNYIDNLTVDIEAVKMITLPINSTLNDGVLSCFLKIIRESTLYKTQNCLFLPYRDLVVPVEGCSIQILGGGNGYHWRCLFYDCSNLYVYDSIPNDIGYDRFTEIEDEYIKLRFRVDKDKVVFPKVASVQPDFVSCGVYAAIFATSLAFGRDPAKERYTKNVQLLRQHLVKIISQKRLTLFPYE